MKTINLFLVMCVVLLRTLVSFSNVGYRSET